MSLSLLPPVAWLSLGLFAPPYKAWFSSPQSGVAVGVELFSAQHLQTRLDPCRQQELASDIMEQQQLPMVVWLRGDEDDFVLSADETMAELNIRRSRLTQISGKELRVGRRRVDRYIKPFYRRVDVQAYKDWTRAAVTHQRSAGVVAEVISDIESRNKTLLQETRGHLTQVMATSVSHLTDVLLATIRSCKKDLKHFLQENEYEQGQRICKRVEYLQKSLIVACDSWQKNISQIQTLEFARLRDVATGQKIELINLMASLADKQAVEIKKLKDHIDNELSSFQDSLGQHLLSALRAYTSAEFSNLKQNLITDMSFVMVARKKMVRSPVSPHVFSQPGKRLAWPSIYYS